MLSKVKANIGAVEKTCGAEDAGPLERHPLESDNESKQSKKVTQQDDFSQNFRSAACKQIIWIV
jgi:hypothetical protein